MGEAGASQTTQSLSLFSWLQWWEKWSFRVQGWGNHDLSQRKDVRDAEHFTLTPPWSPALSTFAEPKAMHEFNCSWSFLLLTF